MDIDPERIRRNIEAAATEDLMDRITFYLGGMEPWVIPLIEQELARRKVGPAALAAWRDELEPLWREEGIALPCTFCRRPAVAQGWGWRRIFRGTLPIWPRRIRYCPSHRPPE